MEEKEEIGTGIPIGYNTGVGAHALTATTTGCNSLPIGGYKRLAVFDFDGTLVDTPLPETGKILYKEKTGKDWPHKGWWGQAESLDMDIFDMPLIEQVIEEYKIACADHKTYVVLMTGRLKKFSEEVKKIVHAKGLYFDAYIFNNGGATIDSKLKSLNKLLADHPKLESVSLWDDRQTHIPTFDLWGASLTIDYKMTVVPSTHHK